MRLLYRRKNEPNPDELVAEMLEALRAAKRSYLTEAGYRAGVGIPSVVNTAIQKAQDYLDGRKA